MAAAAAVEEKVRWVSGRPNGNDVEDEGRIARRPEMRAEIGNNMSILISCDQRYRHKKQRQRAGKGFACAACQGC